MPWWAITLRGLAMGAADVVPGVSGGTMALLLGIYARFIGALSNLRVGLLVRCLRAVKAKDYAELKAAVVGSDVAFLVQLGIGIAVALKTFAKIIPTLIAAYPAHMNALFFGMIATSVIVPFRMMERRTAVHLVIFHGAMAFAFWFSSLAVVGAETTMPILFGSGAIAICAMLLPGVSGSFLLLVLGQYTYVLNAVHNLDIRAIAVFGAGCTVGILSFSRLLNWLLVQYRSATLAALCGLMVGSLQKVWPFKSGQRVEIGGKVVSAGENIWPSPTNYDGQIVLPLCLLACGIVLVLLLETLGRKRADALRASAQ